MASRVYSAALLGLDGVRIEVECDAGMGQYSFTIVGLADTAVQESRERIRSAFRNSGCSFPRGRVTVNLAPADVKKEGPAYDLPIALSILLTDKDFLKKVGCRMDVLNSALFAGELSLDGVLRPVGGVLSMALLVKRSGLRCIFVPRDNAAEASLVDGITVYAVDSLTHLVSLLSGLTELLAFERLGVFNEDPVYSVDMAHIQGHGMVKRALQIAAAGGHNILMSGPPGSGKTLLAKSLPSILPSMTLEESLEVTRIYSVAGLLPKDVSVIASRPFRSPHHTISSVAMIGGGAWPRPGEISLAHRGVLFMDEFPEFPRSVLEALRQPLEDGRVTVSRASGTVDFPAKCMLVAAQNPCPCGFYGDPDRECKCSAGSIASYHKKISGPLLDRIDLCVEVPRVTFDQLTSTDSNDSSDILRQVVEEARGRARDRLFSEGLTCNAEMPSSRVREYCRLDSSGEALLSVAVSKMHLSSRAYYRVLKIARTIADISGKDGIESVHIAEALQYRAKSVI